jgi:predicted amidophosphoribosyltransferase
VRALGAALLELVLPSVCPACDAPRAAGELFLCARCATGVRRLERLRAVHTAIAYQGVGLELVRRFKFDGRHDARAVLVGWLAARVAGLRFDAIVAVPRHVARVRSELRDPVWELARGLARATGAPLFDRVLGRARQTPPQTGLTLAARRANVAGSFAARPRALAGRRVLLVDDVATTGATLVEAARELRRESGAKRITLAAVAGTPAPVL